jgi:hypothetical protein
MGNGIQPQMMPDRFGKTNRLDETKECVSKCLRVVLQTKNADSFEEHGVFCVNEKQKTTLAGRFLFSV